MMKNSEEPLLSQAAGAELPDVPNESAYTLRNDQAGRDFYEFLREKGWEQEPSDIDQNALTENKATIRKDGSGKVYVHYRGKDVLITNKRTREFVLPSTIAINAIEKGLNGNDFVRNVLGVKKYGVGGNTSM